MIVQPQSRAIYSPEEYLEMEVVPDRKHEYINGEIIPMTGGTIAHNIIIGNLLVYLSLALRGKDFNIFFTDLRLWIPERNVYTYPDLMIVSGEIAFHADRKDTITNPILIVEVLSKSTSSYDRGEKFHFYRTIDSLNEYILVEQDQMAVEQFTKIDRNKWQFQSYEHSSEQIEFAYIPATICLADIYDRITF
jgi:Uma2 family endonuclease